MQQLHQNTLDALRRVQGFLDRQAAAIGALISPDTQAELNGDVAQLETSQVEQTQTSGVSKAETANQAAYRKDFYFRFMRPIRRIAKAKLASSVSSRRRRGRASWELTTPLPCSYLQAI